MRLGRVCTSLTRCALLHLGVALPLAGQPASVSPGAIEGVTDFVGTWEVVERLYPGTEREYVERTRRVCKPTLGSAYVECHSRASSDRGEREYVWLMNEPEPGVVEWVTVFTNVPFKGLHRGRFLEDGSGIDLRAFGVEGGELEAGSFQRLRFVSADEYVWEIGLESWDAPPESGFSVERARRVSAPGHPLSDAVEQYLALYEAGDIAALATYVTDDVVFEDPSQFLSGREEFLTGLTTAFEGFTIEGIQRDRVIYSGTDHVLVEGRVKFVVHFPQGDSPMLDVPFSVSLRFREGRVVRHVDFVDSAEFIRQIQGG